MHMLVCVASGGMGDVPDVPPAAGLVLAGSAAGALVLLYHRFIIPYSLLHG